MPRGSELYLRDILQAINRIEAIRGQMSAAPFAPDDLRVDGVLFNLMTIGEAVKNIPEEVRARYPEIRWRDISRFRDRVVHHYFALDLGVVQEIVIGHLPALKTAVNTLLQELEDAGDGTIES